MIPRDVPALINYDIRANYLNIQDLQANAKALKESFRYSPQYYEGEDSLLILEASSHFTLRLPDELRAEGAWYIWYKDGDIITEEMDHPDFQLTNFSAEMAGHYYCKVSHPALHGLELISPVKTIQLKSKDQFDSASVFEEIKPLLQSSSLTRDRQGLTEKIQVPTGITPNGDGINDIFEIKVIGREEQFGQLELMIFSISGQLVFHAKPYKNNWDGSFNNSGRPLPDGIYFYALQVRGAELPMQSGSLTVFR